MKAASKKAKHKEIYTEENRTRCRGWAFVDFIDQEGRVHFTRAARCDLPHLHQIRLCLDCDEPDTQHPHEKDRRDYPTIKALNELSIVTRHARFFTSQTPGNPKPEREEPRRLPPAAPAERMLSLSEVAEAADFLSE